MTPEELRAFSQTLKYKSMGFNKQDYQKPKEIPSTPIEDEAVGIEVSPEVWDVVKPKLYMVGDKEPLPDGEFQQVYE